MTSSWVSRGVWLVPVVAGLFWCAPTETRAQTVPSSYARIEEGQEAGLFAGPVFSNTGRFGFGPGSGFVTGGRYAVELSGLLSMEGVISAMSMTRDVIDPELEEGSRITGEADALLIATDLRFKFSLTGRRTWNGLSPHILAGGGFVFDAAPDQVADERILEQDRFDFGNKFMITTGGGARWLISNLLTLRADAVLNLWQLETPSGYREIGRGFENVEESEWTNTLQLTLGAAIRF